MESRPQRSGFPAESVLSDSSHNPLPFGRHTPCPRASFRGPQRAGDSPQLPLTPQNLRRSRISGGISGGRILFPESSHRSPRVLSPRPSAASGGVWPWNRFAVHSALHTPQSALARQACRGLTAIRNPKSAIVSFPPPLSPCSSPIPMPKSTPATRGNLIAWSGPTASACTS